MKDKAVGRHSSSPPCEVSSTTMSNAQDKTCQGKVIEGVIADSNDEKVILENEIDDVKQTKNEHSEEPENILKSSCSELTKNVIVRTETEDGSSSDQVVTKTDESKLSDENKLNNV